MAHDDAAATSPLDAPPVHPVPGMQDAFEESIAEARLDEEDEAEGHLAAQTALGPEGRRQRLLDLKRYDTSWRARWRQRADATCHPLLKLLAQIIFGLHLLQQRQANSDDEVVRILQAHVDEVDVFVQHTAEDFELAIGDIEERVRFLRLPMEHLDVFEAMLEDQRFRSKLLEGNDKIQRVVDRTSKSMDAALLDLQHGLSANRDLSRYLDKVWSSWPRDVRLTADIAQAMRDNERAWRTCMMDLQASAHTLASRLTQLSSLLKQMSNMSAAAVQRSGSRSSGARSAPSSPKLRSRFAPEAVPPMPMDGIRTATPTQDKNVRPESAAATAAAAMSGDSKPTRKTSNPASISNASAKSSEVISTTTRRDSPAGQSSPSWRSDSLTQRPKTSDGKPHRAREASASSRAEAAASFADLFPASTHVNPLRSNPPESNASRPSASLPRSTSYGAVEQARAPQNNSPARSLPRSQSHEVLGNYNSYLSSLQNGTSILSTTTSATQSVGDAASRNGSPRLAAIPEKHGNIPAVPPISTGFTRRLSKRMKHIQQTPPDHLTIVKTPPQPLLNPQFQRSPHQQKTPTPPMTGTSNYNYSSYASSSRSDSFTGANKPLHPGLAVNGGGGADDAASVATSNQRNGGGGPVPSIASTSVTRRYLKFKNMFHRKDENGRVLSLPGAA